MEEISEEDFTYYSGIDESQLNEILEDYVLKEDMEEIFAEMERDMVSKCKADAEFISD
jgi:hypothetical protein